MTVAGVSTESTIPIPGDPLGGTSMAVECSGSTMITVSEGSPSTHRWTTED